MVFGLVDDVCFAEFVRVVLNAFVETVVAALGDEVELEMVFGLVDVCFAEVVRVVLNAASPIEITRITHSAKMSRNIILNFDPYPALCYMQGNSIKCVSPKHWQTPNLYHQNTSKHQICANKTLANIIFGATVV